MQEINDLKFITKKSFSNEFPAKLKRKKIFFDIKMEIAINFQLIFSVKTLVWTEISNIAFNDFISFMKSFEEFPLFKFS